MGGNYYLESSDIILLMIASYFIVKWAVKNGIKTAFKDIQERRHQKKI